jgi:O-antigen ligase
MTAAHATASLNDFRRDTLPRIADGLAAAVVASLPWSTSATGILIALWLVAILPTLDVAGLRQQVLSPWGGFAVLLAVLAIAGLLWSDASLPERFRGVEPFLRLLMIPVLFAQFRRSGRGDWVDIAFLGSAIILLAASFEMVLMGYGDIGRGVGVPVKDYIAQNGIFVLCAFGLIDFAAGCWIKQRRILALASVGLALLFIGDTLFVTASRTMLVVIPVLFLLWGLLRLSWKGLIGFVLLGVVLGAAVWTASPYVRSRINGISTEIKEFQELGKNTSAGARVQFWKNSRVIVDEAPIIGHGTGTMGKLFLRFTVPGGGAPATNPHNEIFAVAIQLGAVGVALLLAMWAAHWWLMLQPGFAAWVGLAAVTQNIVGSLFNSHLMDFTQAWIYVFAVGVHGGMVLRQRDAPEPAALRAPAPSPQR